MSYFSLYFLVKAGLYYTHYLGFHWGLNLLLALLLSWPLPPGPWQRLRRLLGVPAALALLYHDSLLPTPARVLSQLKALNGFSLDYMQELLGRVFNPLALAGLIGLIVLYGLLARRVRFTTFAFASILSVPLVAAIGTGQAATSTTQLGIAGTESAGPAAADKTAIEANPQNQLQAFYAKEEQRRLSFSTGGKAPPFDIVLLHVCSLSWDDLDFVNERNQPLLKRFDILFSNFNSAASYSGPAALRALHGTCGQVPHEKLYKGVDPQCSLFPNLENTGYKTQGLLNHDGTYDDFAKTLELRAGLKGKLESNRGAPVQMQNFDGSPIYEDYAVLSRWWTDRLTRGPQPVALYYNTISLHDGNHVPGQSSRSSLATYKPRLVKLMADLDKFLSQLENSGKPVVVILMPEHGASLRGDKVQISGMREIPGPRITLVPAAIKLIGFKQPATTTPLVVSQPMSYFGLYSLLGDLLSDSPYKPNARALSSRLEPLQTTPFVAENDDVVVIRNASGSYMMKASDGTWLPYQVE